MKSTILLIDDDPGVRRMLLRLLTEEGYQVVPAGRAEEAFEQASRHPIDLVLLDLNLPAQDGWTIFEKLTTANPLLPVIVITARSNQVFPALASGVAALMEKPLDLPKLLGLIHDLLTEPDEARLARMNGRSAEFHYLPSREERIARALERKQR